MSTDFGSEQTYNLFISYTTEKSVLKLKNQLKDVNLMLVGIQNHLKTTISLHRDFIWFPTHYPHIAPLYSRYFIEAHGGKIQNTTTFIIQSNNLAHNHQWAVREADPKVFRF